MFYKEIESLKSLGEHYMVADVPVREMENGLLSQLLRIGYALLKCILLHKASLWMSSRVRLSDGELLTKKGREFRKYLSLFGEMEVERASYWGKGIGKVYYLDEALMLPKGTALSYNLQELLSESASESDYADSVRVLNRLLGLGLDGKFSQRNVLRLGPLTEGYHRSLPVVAVPDGHVHVVSLDGKGVPMAKVPDGAAGAGSPKRRRSKGERPNVAKMATVAVVSHLLPKVRSARDIVQGLMYAHAPKAAGAPARDENDNRWHRDVRRRAFLGDQQGAVEDALGIVAGRIAEHGGTFVVPMDAGAGLEEKVLECVGRYRLEAHFGGIILDILHVSEYAWDAATAIFGEAATGRQPWVEEMLMDILEGRVERVVADLERAVEKGNLTKAAAQTVRRTANYFSNHKHKMKYPEYLQKGYPVSSALVEAACGHLVKDRMELSGMRWSHDGAQNILNIRALKQNGDLTGFFDWVIKNEHTGGIHIAA
jgi:hypothetical protein